MKLPMMLGCFGGLFACLFIEGAYAQNAGGDGSSAKDVIVQQVANALMVPCSCDCCEVAERMKSEYLTASDGSTVKVKCVPPGGTPIQGVDTQTGGRCPATCKASNADRTLTAAETTMDQSRYCQYKCKPAAGTVGSNCVRLSEKEVEETRTDDGNGKEAAQPVPQIETADDGFTGQAAAQAPASDGSAPAAAAKESEDQSMHVRWDIRKVIAQRLRAEAGADMARAAATEQRIHSDEYVTKKDKQMIDYVHKALTPVAGKGQEAQVATESEAKTASEEAAIAQQHLLEAQVDSVSVVEETKKLVKAEIKKQAAAAAKQEAEADAYMAAWDKPDNWGKTLAVRAASPYLQEMVTAITRVSEYEGFSKGLLSQAKGAQAQANAKVLQENRMRSEGDLLGAATEEKKINLLIKKAQDLEEEANNYWKIADETRKSIPEWQMGGNMAAARAAWEFKISFTPAPEI